MISKTTNKARQLIILFLLFGLISIQAIKKSEPKEKIPVIEVVFALDATGSMSGLIETAKEKIWSIATNIALAEPAPELRMGFIFYRDRGDTFTTKIVSLTNDLDKMYENLMTINASGGGDTPESVNQALTDATNNINWSEDETSYRVIFLVGDCPPHMDYSDDVKYTISCELANEKKIIINTIQLGNCSNTETFWKEIAQLTNGSYFRADQNAPDISVSTPFDSEISTLSSELDMIRYYYGSKEETTIQKEKIERAEKIAESSSIETKTRRAVYNTTASGSSSYYGSNELLSDYENNKINLDSISLDFLPENMQKMTVQERKTFVSDQLNKRKELTKKINDLASKRQEYIQNELLKNATSSKDSFTNKVIETVKIQAAKKDMVIEGPVIH